MKKQEFLETKLFMDQ